MAGLLDVLSQTWPAKTGKGILDAIQLPGQVAGGILAVQPSKPGMWSDEDEARSQLTNQTMMQRATGLAGLMMMGASGAPAITNAVGMGVRTLPSDNYLTNLSKYTKNLYRETSPELALEVLPGANVYGGSIAGQPMRQFYADAPDMALGQGTNKGVRVGYDASKFEGQINQSKPGWQPAFENGMAEYLATPSKGADPRSAVQSVDIDKGMLAGASRVVRAQYEHAMNYMKQSGWEMTDGPQAFSFRKVAQ